MKASLKELSALALNDFRKKHSAVPDHALPSFKYEDSTSNGLTKAITDFITFNGGYCTRINTQGQYNRKLGKFTRSTTKKGTADIHAILNGAHLSIEVKIGKDKLSPHQIKTAAEVKNAGGVYFVAKDFDCFYEWFNDQKMKGEQSA